MFNIVKSEINHLPLLKKVIDSNELFPAEYLDGMMNDYFTNVESTDYWVTSLYNEIPIAISYFAPERMTEGTYNLYLIAVHKDYQGRGIGCKLMEYVENKLKESGTRILIVETSGLPEFELTRKFYEKLGYTKEAIIRDFYKDGEDKVVFWKKLISSSHSP